MSRNQTSQPQRTQNNPLVLGTFSSTALRYLHGSLGPKYQVIGRADTRTQSNGGFGGGTYNHWFQINSTEPFIKNLLVILVIVYALYLFGSFLGSLIHILALIILVGGLYYVL